MPHKADSRPSVASALFSGYLMLSKRFARNLGLLVASGMNQLNLQLMSGREARDAGIQRALDSAERKVMGWPEMAYGYLLEYLCHAKRFQVEDFRNWAYQAGLEVPPSERAFGGVILRAKAAGKVRFAGYESVTNPRAHRTPASVWERVF